MLEQQESLLPNSKPGEHLRVLAVGVDKYGEESLEELKRLLDTLGVNTVGQVIMMQRSINPATYIGSGKLEEVRQLAEKESAKAVLFDVDLTPNQLKNLEKQLGIAVLDRSGVIIEIFSQHARTREAKVQVELARLQYLMPRLAHFWTHFERQRGGIGMKGMGETQIEVDRRLVKKRMSTLRAHLKEIENERTIQRAARGDVLKVALVGYTNAGKSTLLNSLTHSRVLAEDKLFATLDSSVRLLNPDSHPPIVLIDTVGFISRLPPSLVASFRSTLEELREADLLLHVVDASSVQARDQLEVTEAILKEMGLEAKPKMIVLNKIDLAQTPAARNRTRLIAPGAVAISALKESDVRDLRERIKAEFQRGFEVWEGVIPYAESKVESQLHSVSTIEVKRHLEKGTFFRIRIPQSWVNKLELSRFQTGK